MIELLARRVNAWGIAGLTVTSLVYGYLILNVLPFWRHLEAVEGGRDLQERYFYGSAAARDALVRIVAGADGDARAFYLIDLPNAFLFALSIGALIGLGLRWNGLAESSWRWLIGLPILSGLLDWTENAMLFVALAQRGRVADPVLALLGAISGLKLVTGNASIAVMVVLIVVGLVRRFFILRSN